MSFALDNTRLWQHIDGTIITPPLFMLKGDDSKY